MFPVIYNPKKLGYYQVGSVETFSKIEAIELQMRTGHFPTWNFNKETFQRINWFDEPKESLWNLYKQKARQIRQSYDYVVIMYSGGSDTDNILKAWLEEGCRLDEIATMKAIDVNYEHLKAEKTDWNTEGDIVVVPTIQKLRQQGYKFKFRVIDAVDYTKRFLEKYSSEYMYYSNCCFSPNNIAKSNLREIIPDYINIINSGKKLCFLWGSDKPQIEFKEGDGWYIKFLDMIDNCISPYTQNNYNLGWYDELFYWQPDLPELLVKQAHTVKNFCQKIDEPSFYQNTASPYGKNSRIKKWLSMDGIKKVIYPKWDDNIYVAGKNWGIRPNFGFINFSSRDKWFFDSNTELASKYENHFVATMKNLEKNPHFNWVDYKAQSAIINCVNEYKFSN